MPGTVPIATAAGRGNAGATGVTGGVVSPAGAEPGTLRFASLSLSDAATTVIDLPDLGATPTPAATLAPWADLIARFRS